MEPRIATLETHVEHIKNNIADLKSAAEATRTEVNNVSKAVERLEERVKHLPGKGFIVSATLLSITLATSFMVLQQKIQELLGLR